MGLFPEVNPFLSSALCRFVLVSFSFLSVFPLWFLYFSCFRLFVRSLVFPYLPGSGIPVFISGFMISAKANAGFHAFALAGGVVWHSLLMDPYAFFVHFVL